MLSLLWLVTSYIVESKHFRISSLETNNYSNMLIWQMSKLRTQVFNMQSSGSSLLSSGPRLACQTPDSKSKHSVQLTARRAVKPQSRRPDSHTPSALASIRHCTVCFARVVTLVPRSVSMKADTITIVLLTWQVRKLRLTEANLVVRPNWNILIHSSYY